MLRDKLMEAMGNLKLYGMKSALDEVMAAGIKQRRTPEKILLDLLEAEMAERTARSIRYRLGQARFPVDKDLDRFEFGASAANETQVRSLYQGGFLSTKSNIILIGRHRDRQNPSGDSYSPPSNQKRQKRAVLQCGRSGQPA